MMNLEQPVVNSEELLSVAPENLEPYRSARPPKMTNPLEFPAQTSLRGSMGECLHITDLDQVDDPLWPWQHLDSKTPGGQRRIEEMKLAKKSVVQEYVITHAHQWFQFKDPFETGTERTVTNVYKVGRRRARNTTVEQGVEVTLGVEADIFTASAKATLDWTTETSTSFDDEHTLTVEDKFEPSHWYIFWQTLEIVTLWRRTKSAPDTLALVSEAVGNTAVTFTDVVAVAKSAEAPPIMGNSNVTFIESDAEPIVTEAPLSAQTGFGEKEKALDPGCTRWFNGRAGYTKFRFLNTSNNDDGEATITYGWGMQARVTIKPLKSRNWEIWLLGGGRIKVTNSSYVVLDVLSDY